VSSKSTLTGAKSTGRKLKDTGTLPIMTPAELFTFNVSLLSKFHTIEHKLDLLLAFAAVLAEKDLAALKASSGPTAHPGVQ